MPVNATFGSIVHAGIYRWQIPPVNATGQPWLNVLFCSWKLVNCWLINTILKECSQDI